MTSTPFNLGLFLQQYPALNEQLGRSESATFSFLMFSVNNPNEKFGMIKEGRRYVYNSVKFIASELRYSVITIQRALRKLERLGLIHIDNRDLHISHGKRWYTVIWEKVKELSDKIQKSFSKKDKKTETDGKKVEVLEEISSLQEPIEIDEKETKCYGETIKMIGADDQNDTPSNNSHIIPKNFIASESKKFFENFIDSVVRKGRMSYSTTSSVGSVDSPVGVLPNPAEQNLLKDELEKKLVPVDGTTNLSVDIRREDFITYGRDYIKSSAEGSPNGDLPEQPGQQKRKDPYFENEEPFVEEGYIKAYSLITDIFENCHKNPNYPAPVVNRAILRKEMRSSLMRFFSVTEAGVTLFLDYLKAIRRSDFYMGKKAMKDGTFFSLGFNTIFKPKTQEDFMEKKGSFAESFQRTPKAQTVEKPKYIQNLDSFTLEKALEGSTSDLDRETKTKLFNLMGPVTYHSWIYLNNFKVTGESERVDPLDGSRDIEFSVDSRFVYDKLKHDYGTIFGAGKK